MKLYKVIRENGGWDNWNMDIVEILNCANSIEARKKHFRNFVRQDEIMTRRIWTNPEFQRKLEQSIQANNIIFETLLLDAGLGRRKRRHTIKNKKKK